MMDAFIIVSCLIGGTDCRKHVEVDSIPHSQCMSQSQILLAKYIGEHPNREIKRFICDDRRRIPFYIGSDQA